MQTLTTDQPFLLEFVMGLHDSSLAVCRQLIIIIWLILYTYFHFVNSLLTDIQNVDHITNSIIKVKIVFPFAQKNM